MPAYDATYPPFSLFPGDVGTSINAETVSNGTACSQFAMAGGQPDDGKRPFSVDVTTSGNVATMNVAVEVASVDNGSYYSAVQYLSAAGHYDFPNPTSLFARLKVVSSTGGGKITGTITR